MSGADVLVDGYDRIKEVVHDATRGLDEEALVLRVDPAANSIAWLVWHLTRVQDDHLAGAAGTEQVWLAEEWRDRFALPFDDLDIGYGHSSEQVAQVRAGTELLLGYHDAVHERSTAYVSGLSDAELREIIDANWSPPVTRGVRLVSVLADGLQHAGQAALLRGFVA